MFHELGFVALNKRQFKIDCLRVILAKLLMTLFATKMLNNIK